MAGIGDRAFDRQRLRALHDRGDDRTAQQIAPVKSLLAAAPQGDLEKLIFFPPRELHFENALNQPVDRGADVARFLRQRAIVGKIVREINPVDGFRAFAVRPVHFNFPVDPARPQNCRVDQVRAVGGQDDDDVVQRIDAIHFRAKHRNQRRENVRGTRGAARAENAFRFVDEEEGQETFAPFLARGRKDFAHDALRFADPHVQDFRPLDVHEVFLHFFAALLAQLLRQVVGRRFADQRLAAAGRAVEEKTFRRGVLKFREELPVNQGQLDRVPDGLQRLILSADFLPGKLGNVVEIMFAGLRAGKNLERYAIIRIDPHLVAGFESRLHQLSRALQDQ